MKLSYEVKINKTMRYLFHVLNEIQDPDALCKCVNSIHDAALLDQTQFKYILKRFDLAYSEDIGAYPADLFHFGGSNPSDFYSQLYSFEELLELKKLDSVMEPVVINTSESYYVICPTCGREIFSPLWSKETVDRFHVTHCLYCRQRFTGTYKLPGHWRRK